MVTRRRQKCAGYRSRRSARKSKGTVKSTPRNGDYSLLARVASFPGVSYNPALDRIQRFDISINNKTFPNTSNSGYWYLKETVERVIYLSSLGELKAPHGGFK